VLDMMCFADEACTEIRTAQLSNANPTTSPTLAADVMTSPCPRDAEERTLYLKIVFCALDSLEKDVFKLRPACRSFESDVGFVKDTEWVIRGEVVAPHPCS
jgi:hypothetical protein